MNPLIWSILLTVIMVVLILMEMLTPSFGLLTLLAVTAMIGSVVFGFEASTTAGFSMVAVNLAIFPIALFTAMRILQNSPLRHNEDIQAGVPDGPTVDGTKHELVGREGVAITDLRPSGSAAFGDLRKDVVTTGKYVDRGQKVKILRVEGSRIIVDLVI